MIKLSILIPTIVGREDKYDSLCKNIFMQCRTLGLIKEGEAFISKNEFGREHFFLGQVEIQSIKDNREISIGTKRNQLMSIAAGEYTAFVDDDDRVSENYVRLLLEGIEKNVDCCSLLGEITFDGKDAAIYEHSLKYNAWKTNEGAPYGEVKYERFPNHLNAIRASIAKQFKFPEKNHGEDFDWSTLVHESGLIKTEHYINEVIYFYDFITNKK